MKDFFTRNLDRRGRLFRGLCGVTLLVAAGIAFGESVWVGLVLAGMGAFACFEALRGWCVLRACGLKTRI